MQSPCTGDIANYGYGLFTTISASSMSGIPDAFTGLGNAIAFIRMKYGEAAASTILMDIEGDKGIYARRTDTNDWVKIV